MTLFKKRGIVSHYFVRCFCVLHLKNKDCVLVSPLDCPPLPLAPPPPVLAIVRLRGGVTERRQPRPQQARQDRAVVEIVTAWEHYWRMINLIPNIVLTHVSPRP